MWAPNPVYVSVNNLYLLSDLSSCCMCTCVYMLMFLFAEGWCSGCYLCGLIFVSCGRSLSRLRFVRLCGMVAVWPLAARCQVLECSSLLPGDLVLFSCCSVVVVGVDGVHVCFIFCFLCRSEERRVGKEL